MPTVIRLQDPYSTAAAATQRVEEAQDVGPHRYLTVQLRKLHTAALTGSVTLQHAPVLDEDAFEDLSTTFNLSGGGNLVNVYSNTHRFLRWKIASLSGGTASFLIDIVGREGTSSTNGVMRLQEPMTLAADANQRLEAAIDLLEYRSLAVQVRKLVAGGGAAALYLQHAPVLFEDAFMDVAASFSTDGVATFNLAATGNETHGFTNLMRYVRWRGDYVSGASPVFQVDLVGRGV